MHLPTALEARTPAPLLSREGEVLPAPFCGEQRQKTAAAQFGGGISTPILPQGREIPTKDLISEGGFIKIGLVQL